MQSQRARARSPHPCMASAVAAIVAALFLLAACGGDPLNNTTSGGSSLAPTILTPPASTTVTLGQPASFSVSASGSTPLTYQWLRSNQEIAGANQSTYRLDVTTALDNNAMFSVRVSNSFGTVTSGAATLTVQ